MAVPYWNFNQNREETESRQTITFRIFRINALCTFLGTVITPSSKLNCDNTSRRSPESSTWSLLPWNTGDCSEWDYSAKNPWAVSLVVVFAVFVNFEANDKFSSRYPGSIHRDNRRRWGLNFCEILRCHFRVEKNLLIVRKEEIICKFL